MNEAPQWWYVVSGVFFVFGILFYLVLIALLVFLIQAIKKLSARVEQLMTKVDGITKRVDTLVGDVRDIAQTVGKQATGAATNLQQITAAAAQKAELASTVFLALGLIRAWMGSRKQSRKG